METNEPKPMITNEDTKKKTNPLFVILFFLFPLAGLAIPYFLFRRNFSPVLTEDMLSELAFVKYLVEHNSHTFAEGWVSTKPFVPLSTRFFLTYYYTDFANWKNALLDSVTCVYAIFAASYIFFVTSFHAKKIYAYIVSAIPAFILGYYGLKAVYQCSYLLTLFCPVLICLGILIHGMRFKIPIPFRILISALVVVPPIMIGSYMSDMKETGSFDNTNLLSVELSKNIVLTDISGYYSGLIDFLESESIPVSYCTDTIVNEITVLSDGKVNVAPVAAFDDLTPVEIETDSFKNPYDMVSRDNEPFYMIYDKEAVQKNASSNKLRFAEVIYEDERYSVYSYKSFTYYDDGIFQDNLVRLASEKYDSFYYSFLGSTIKDSGSFPEFSGTDPIFINPSTAKYENINVLLDTALKKKDLKSVFFEIDPIAFCEENGRDELNYINGIIERNKKVSFYITLSYPESEYWKSLDTAALNARLADYKTVFERLSANKNLKIFWPGSQKWLVESPENYQNGVPKSDAACNLLVLTVCNLKYLVEEETLNIYTDEIKDIVEADESYPDLSDYELVFFGDSIIGNYHGPISIPGMSESLSGARSYNLGYGGTSAVNEFNTFVDCVTADKSTDSIENKEFVKELKHFKNESDETKKKIFVIYYGVNDYFLGVPARTNTGIPYEDYPYDSYESGLSDGILKLKSTYPDSLIYVVSPIYCNYFEGGKNPQSEAGSNLDTYRDVSKEVSEKYHVEWMDSIELIDINKDNWETYLVDGVHPTAEGIYLISKAIIKKIGGE
ncbi:MAG: SGNH/GDSL hydrolase family protein [Lachnospiraceae bacterium]|nr:SGNH/GDSL hydrolase family protein [Lachnospiraceae bacterium]